MKNQSQLSRRPARRAFSSLFAALALASLSVPAFGQTGAERTPPPIAAGPAKASPLTAEEALRRLIEGNQRYVAGTPSHPDQTNQRRAELAGGQTPFAVVLTCSDSRVAPELFFDQGLGDLFVIRNAGNVLDDHVLGTMEYAVEHLHVGLIVVVGHAKCGAVSAAVAGGEVPGHIRSLVESIEPALEEAKNEPGDKVDNGVRANALRTAGILPRVEPILKAAAQAGKLTVVAARYDLASGQVEILKPASQPPAK